MNPEPSQEPWLQDQVVLILCGLIGSGKTTFAEQLEQHYPKFRRCNQDDLGDRRKVEQVARNSLSQGLSVCIDRTNFNADQRYHWIKIAREFPGTSIWVIVFDTPYEVCKARLLTRVSHPTITSPEQGLRVLSHFASNFEHPAPQEGYNHLISLKHAEHTSPIYSRADIAAILQRVSDSPIPVSTLRFPQQHASQSFQGWQQHSSVNFQRGHARGRYPGSRGRGWSAVRGHHSTSTPLNPASPPKNRQARGRYPMTGAGNNQVSSRNKRSDTAISESSDNVRLHTQGSVTFRTDGGGTKEDPYII